MGKYDEAEALYIRLINLGICFIYTWLKVFRIILEFRILRLRDSSTDCQSQNSEFRNNAELGRV